MYNIVEAYLMFKSNNVCDYINILAEDMRYLSKIPKQLNKLVYKYYDLFVLSNKNIDYEMLRNKTGLDVSNDRLSLFYLLIEFDMASKTEYKNDKMFQFYNFIVNSILIFSELEREKTLNNDLSYDMMLKKILNKYLDYIDDEYVVLLDRLYTIIDRKYNKSLKQEIKFKEKYLSDTFDVYFSKIKKSDNLYLGKFRYRNDKLLEEGKKDVELINTEFLYELDLVNIEMLSMKILESSWLGNDKCVFVRISDDLIIKKNNFNFLINMVKLRFLKEKMIFVINTSVLEKNEERLNYLIDHEYTISYLKNSELTSYDIYKNGGYLFINADENIKLCLNFAKNNNLEVIINKINKKNVEKLNNVMYVT